jgi:hypothetical protein
MSTVEELLHRYIADQRASGRANARTYLEQASGQDRIELAAHIDRYLAQAAGRPFDADAFARFRADPRRQAMVERILDDTTLEALRRQASVSKVRLAASLAAALGLAGRQQQVKARYHDIETGTVDPSRVRPRVWEALADMLGATAERVRASAESAYTNAGGGLSGQAYARTAVTSVGATPVRTTRATGDHDTDEDAVDRVFFED